MQKIRCVVREIAYQNPEKGYDSIPVMKENLYKMADDIRGMAKKS